MAPTAAPTAEASCTSASWATRLSLPSSAMTMSLAISSSASISLELLVVTHSAGASRGAPGSAPDGNGHEGQSSSSDRHTTRAFFCVTTATSSTGVATPSGPLPKPVVSSCSPVSLTNSCRRTPPTLVDTAACCGISTWTMWCSRSLSDTLGRRVTCRTSTRAGLTNESSHSTIHRYVATPLMPCLLSGRWLPADAWPSRHRPTTRHVVGGTTTADGADHRPRGWATLRIHALPKRRRRLMDPVRVSRLWGKALPAARIRRRSRYSSISERALRHVAQLAALGEVRVGARRQVETARPPLPVVQLRDAHLDPTLPCLRVARRLHPTHPLPPGHRRDVLPHRTDLRGCLGQGGCEVVRHVRLGPVPRHLQGELGRVTRADVGGPLEGVVDADPVATAAVRLDDGLEVVCPERGAHGHLPARGEPLAGLLRQAHEGRVVDRGQVRREADRRRVGRSGRHDYLRVGLGSRRAVILPGPSRADSSLRRPRS